MCASEAQQALATVQQHAYNMYKAKLAANTYLLRPLALKQTFFDTLDRPISLNYARNALFD